VTTRSVTEAAAPPIALARAVAELLALSGERDRWAERLGEEFRAGFALGRALGVEEGRRAEARERDSAWNAIARPVARGGVTHAEIERVRWAVRGEPRTRAEYGLPHKDDYTGRGAA
jgi:hypothetical protein